MNSKRWLFVVLALALAVAFGTTQLSAQTSTSGSIIGVVTDPSGAVVPNATVTLKNITEGTVSTAKTNASGTFQVQLLKPGMYTMTVEATGFQKNERTVTVAVSNVTSANVQLAITSAGTTVTVTEAAPLIQSDNGNVNTTLNQSQVSQVPNPGNDLSYIGQLAAGSVMNTGGGYGNFSSYGLPATSNLFTLNGMDNNDPFLNLNNSGATNLLLGQNEIAEATIVQNGYSGSFGGLAGANVNYVTKSGGNQFHGNAIYYWNGKAMNAEDFISNASGVPGLKANDNVNQWAASIGGPIKKDKLFFFFNTEGLRVLLPAASASIKIPSPAFEAATITNLTNQGLTASASTYQAAFNLYNAAQGAGNATAGQFPGQSNADSCSSAFTGFLQQSVDPNLGVTEPCVLNFISSPTNLTHEGQYAGRMDWNIGPKDTVFFRYQYDVGVQATFTDRISPIFDARSTQPEHQGQMQETHVFGPTATNQLLISGQWYSAIFSNADRNAALAAFPTTWILADGTLSRMGNALYDWPQGRNVSQAQINDDFSKTFGSHTLKLGGKYRRNWINDFDFGVLTSGIVEPFSLQDYYNGGIDPEFGVGSLAEAQFPSALNQPFAEYSLQLYVEDSWRARSNLTLTLALRAEHFSNPVCQHLCGSGLIGTFTNVSGDPNIGDVPYNQAILTNKKQALNDLQAIMFEPRFNFAWQPFQNSTNFLTKNVVIRGGIGLYADQFPGQAAELAANNPPNNNFYLAFNNYISPGETTPTFSPNGSLIHDLQATNLAFVSGFTSGITSNQLGALTGGILPGLTTFDARNSYPQYEKWSLEVQKGFGQNTSLAVSYVGNHGYHELIQNNSIDAFTPGFTFGSLPGAPPDPRFATVNWITSGGISNYNGMTVAFQHRFAKGQVAVNYTWSHAFDEISNGGFLPFSGNATVPQDPYNFRGNYGPADYDARHYINGNYVYELPIRSMFHGHGNKYLVDGWQVSGAVFFRTGLPFSVTDGLQTSILSGGNYLGTVLPNFLGGSLATCGTGAYTNNPVTPCFTTSQFQTAGTETGFSSGQRNKFYGPGYFNTDMSVVKNTQIPGWEAGKLGIGLQFFNLFNHPNFANPDGDITSSTFGQITGLVSSPTSILGSFLGGNASPRLIQLKLSLTF